MSTIKARVILKDGKVSYELLGYIGSNKEGFSEESLKPGIYDIMIVDASFEKEEIKDEVTKTGRDNQT